MRTEPVGVACESSLLKNTVRIALWIAVRWSFDSSDVRTCDSVEPLEVYRSCTWVICSGERRSSSGERSRVGWVGGTT